MGDRPWPEALDPVVAEFQDCFDSMERYELLFEYCLLYTSDAADD